MEYYSAIKKNTFESVLIRWMKLEPIIQSDPRTEEPGRLQSMGSQRVGHNRVTNTHSFTKGNQA